MRPVSLFLTMAATMASSSMAVAQSPLPPVRTGVFSTDNGILLRGSGMIIGAPISLHNYLHFKQAVDKLHADFLVIKRNDGGTLTPAHDAELRARYFTLDQQIQIWIRTANNDGAIAADTWPATP